MGFAAAPQPGSTGRAALRREGRHSTSTGVRRFAGCGGGSTGAASTGQGDDLDSLTAVHQVRHLPAQISDPWAKPAAAYHLVGDPSARDKLLARHPAATAGIGDLYALAQDWKHALAEYNKAITNGSKDARTFAARAEVYEKFDEWELAAADRGNADRHAIDKGERYGNPSLPYLERRTWIWSRLQEHEKIVLDCNELRKPERFGDNPWFFTKRGKAYDGLRQWQKARADYDQALRVCSPEERGSFRHYRARHFAAQGQWKNTIGCRHAALRIVRTAANSGSRR